MFLFDCKEFLHLEVPFCASSVARGCDYGSDSDQAQSWSWSEWQH
jgi:hypothetical protein